ncbi:hypothetical protein [Sphingomonas bacterium]|uniref:hypothetical protein n=1 Tax=Sphingomonas bacterium TaxID=1895847 RepID=UPI0015758E00|nr:hypothetical protein [Sphingomonas bacterium]
MAITRQRCRSEATTLEALGAFDKLLIGQAELLRTTLDGTSGEAALAPMPDLQAGVAAMADTLRRRQTALFGGGVG